MISYWIRTLVQQGRWEEIVRSYIEDPPCPPWTSGSQAVSAEGSSDSLTPLHCLGAFLIMGLCIILAMAVHLSQHAVDRSATQIAKAVSTRIVSWRGSAASRSSKKSWLSLRFTRKYPATPDSDDRGCRSLEERGAVSSESCGHMDGGEPQAKGHKPTCRNVMFDASTLDGKDASGSIAGANCTRC